MTKEEAWKIIESCKDWNTSQRSISSCFRGVRTDEDDYLNARREALRKAWLVVGEKEDDE